MVDFVVVLAVLVSIVLIVFFYTQIIKPKPTQQGMYINKSKRPSSEIITPDGRGNIKGFIDEEGYGGQYTSIVVEGENYTYVIPHVVMGRDCKPWNLKQAYAGTDRPVMICCVDKDGVRHPSMQDALTSGVFKTFGEEDAENENTQLRIQVAKAKDRLRKITHDDEFHDKMKAESKVFAELRRDMWTGIENDKQGYGETREEEGP
jgi:hypothetical protein